MAHEPRAGSGPQEARYEPPCLTVHGSVAESTAASIIGTNFDQTIPAGASILSILGRLSL